MDSVDCRRACIPQQQPSKQQIVGRSPAGARRCRSRTLVELGFGAAAVHAPRRASCWRRPSVAMGHAVPAVCGARGDGAFEPADSVARAGAAARHRTLCCDADFFAFAEPCHVATRRGGTAGSSLAWIRQRGTRQCAGAASASRTRREDRCRLRSGCHGRRAGAGACRQASRPDRRPRRTQPVDQGRTTAAMRGA